MQAARARQRERRSSERDAGDARPERHWQVTDAHQCHAEGNEPERVRRVEHEPDSREREEQEHRDAVA